MASEVINVRPKIASTYLFNILTRESGSDLATTVLYCSCRSMSTTEYYSELGTVQNGTCSTFLPGPCGLLRDEPAGPAT